MAMTAVWQTWNTGYYQANITASATASTWTLWNNQYAVATTNATTTSCMVGYPAVWAVWNQPVQQRVETAEEAAERQANHAESIRQAEERNRRLTEERKAAEQKATILLLSLLNKRQQEEYQKNKEFVVYSKDRKRRYKLTKAYSHSVLRLDDAGRPIESLCVVPRQRLVYEDEMVAQKLMLEHCEDDFLKIANRIPIRQPLAQAA